MNHSSPLKWSLTLVASIGVSLAHAAEPLRVEVARDTWVSSYRTEVEGNNGASPKLKLKGVQELSLIDIDTASLRGKRVTKAQLHLHGEGDDTLGRITVSSIVDEWVEGDGTGYRKVPGASSFAWARTGERRWRGGLPDITGVINGAGGSIWGFADATPRDADGWQIIPVEPAVVQARIDGRSFGFSVMDDVGSEYTREGDKFTYHGFPNRYVSSKDGKRATRPFFTLWLDDTTAAAAAAPIDQPAVDVKPATLPPLSGKKAAGTLPVECRDEFGEPITALEFYAAKGETISFSVAGKAEIHMSGVRTQLFTMPLVEGHADPLVPSGFTGAPVADGDSTCIEIHVPKSTPSGRIEGTLRVGTHTLPCVLTVWNFTLPDHLSFIVQMNCYGLPGHERDYYRMAHEHRTTLNCLPYNWRGSIHPGPEIKSDGSWDWSKWDAMHGPLLDGSAFADLPRGAIPVEALYVMLNENWPMNHERHFKGGYWIESAYDDPYWTEFRESVSRTARHLTEKGWSQTMFEFYLNNKVSNKKDRWDRCSAAWTFDEPSNTQDFWALRRFGIEFWKGAAAHPGSGLVFRGDISRPQWQRDLLDGVMNVEVVSGALRVYGEGVIERAQRLGNLVYMYGGANAIGTPNVRNAAWCAETWALGADGAVPWQTVGKPASWQKADELSLFYPTSAGPVPSLRLKTFRAGQQLVEYLTMFTVLSGQSRRSVGAAVLQEPGMRAVTVKKNEDDAGKAAFGPETHTSLSNLRMKLGLWLDAKAPPARDRWHDPRPRPHDARAVKVIEPVIAR